MSPVVENLNSTSEYSKTLFIQSAMNERQLVFMLGDFKLPNFSKSHYPAVGLVVVLMCCKV